MERNGDTSEHPSSMHGPNGQERTVAHSALRLGGEDAVNKEVAIAADHYHHNHDHHVKHYILQPYSFGPGSIPVTGLLKLFFSGTAQIACRTRYHLHVCCGRGFVHRGW